MASAKSPANRTVQTLDPERSVGGASYLNRTAQTPDPWKLCASLEYGGDRSFATAVEQLVVQTEPKDWPKLETQLPRTNIRL